MISNGVVEKITCVFRAARYTRLRMLLEIERGNNMRHNVFIVTVGSHILKVNLPLSYASMNFELAPLDGPLLNQLNRDQNKVTNVFPLDDCVLATFGCPYS